MAAAEKDSAVPDVFSDDLLGDEDDVLECQELGIDYLTSDRNVESAMGEGKAPVYSANPGNTKQLRKRAVRAEWQGSTLVVHFADGDRLIIKE